MAGKGPIRQAIEPSQLTAAVGDHHFRHRPHHHRGCIELAKPVLTYTPDLLAENVVKNRRKT